MTSLVKYSSKSNFIFFFFFVSEYYFKYLKKFVYSYTYFECIFVIILFYILTLFSEKNNVFAYKLLFINLPTNRLLPVKMILH